MNPSASLDTPDATPKRDDGLPKSPAFRASVKRRSLCAFTCLRSRPKRALAKAFEGDGLSQRTGLMSTMIIGAIEVRPARESENAMSWPEVTVKAVSNSDEVVFRSSSGGRSNTVTTASNIVRRRCMRHSGPQGASTTCLRFTSIRSIPRSL